MTLDRDRIITTLVSALQPLDYVEAVWQGGAAAFNRVDEWSDIDLVIDAHDDRAADVWPVIDDGLRGLSEVDLRYIVPNPPLGLHGTAATVVVQREPERSCICARLMSRERFRFLPTTPMYPSVTT